MLKDTYFGKLNELLRTIQESQGEKIDQAARAIADAMAAGRGIHVYDTGHMLDSELIFRAGGLTAYRALRIRFDVDNEVRSRPEDAAKERSMEGLMRYALKASKLLPGDILIIGSVSGKTVNPVDLALCAKEAGAYVIGMTSVAYSSMLRSDHSSGKRLFEVADLVLDNCAPPLDALVEVPELDISMCPASGLAACAIMWAVQAQVVDNLLALNIKPGIDMSINFPGGAEYSEGIFETYAKTGW